MKICSVCKQRFDSPDFVCKLCSYQPKWIDGYRAFAPELAIAGGSYDPDFFEQLYELEGQNFWFRARNQLIVWALQCYFPTMQNFLEVGCGTGYVLSGIEQAFPDLVLSGSEIFVEGLHIAAKRLLRTELFQMDACQIPFATEFDVIGSFDVLEHIEDDVTVLAEMHKAIRPGGGILLTVPQHPWLWSQADDFAHHVRRYRAHDLRLKMKQSGFRTVRITSFMSLLLPLMAISRLRQRHLDPDYDGFSEFRISAWINDTLEHVLRLERTLIQLGVSFPMGGSLLLVAQKLWK